MVSEVLNSLQSWEGELAEGGFKRGNGGLVIHSETLLITWTYLTPALLNNMMFWHDVNSLTPGDAVWCIRANVNIGSGNGLTPVGCQAITWNTVDLWSIASLGIKSGEL